MSDLKNIDELLKHQFDGFAPDAPDVWQGIEQGVGQAVVNASSGVTAAAKTGITLGAKMIITVAAVAGIAAAVIVYSNTSGPRKEAAMQATPVTTSATSPAPENGAASTEEEANPGTTEMDPHRNAVQPVAALPVQEKQPVLKKRNNDHAPAHTEANEVKIQDDQYSKSTVNSPEGSDIQTEPSAKQETQENRPVGVHENKLSAQPAAKNQPAVAKPKETKTGKPADRAFFPEQEETRPVIPDVFTPDNNGQNDRFTIIIENETMFYLVIKDLNGNEVFSSSDRHKTWDGINMKNGEPCAEGWYYYEFHYQFKTDDKSSYKPGRVFLKR